MSDAQKQHALVEQMMLMFSRMDLEIFLSLRLDAESAADKLSSLSQSRQNYFFFTVSELKRNNMLNERFRGALRADRKNRIDEINKLKDGDRKGFMAFLLDAYSLSELRSFLTYKAGAEKIVDQIERATQFQGAVSALALARKIDNAFFDALVAERPNWKAEINALRADWLSNDAGTEEESAVTQDAGVADRPPLVAVKRTLER